MRVRSLRSVIKFICSVHAHTCNKNECVQTKDTTDTVYTKALGADDLATNATKFIMIMAERCDIIKQNAKWPSVIQLSKRIVFRFRSISHTHTVLNNTNDIVDDTVYLCG